MGNKVTTTEMDGTPKQIVFGDIAGDFNPTAANDLRDATSGNRTTCQLTLASLADAAARQSAKVDLGTDRAQAYDVRIAIEFAAGVAAGDVCHLYWGTSQSGTAGTANPGNLTGADAAYAGYSSNLADSLYHLKYIGSIRATAQATATIQVADVGVFYPTERYGSLVVVAGDDFHSDDVEMHVVFNPIIDEIQP